MAKIGAMVHDSTALIGIIIVDDDGEIMMIHSQGNDNEVLEYARAGDFLLLARRLENNDATPEMLKLAADVLDGTLK